MSRQQGKSYKNFSFNQSNILFILNHLIFLFKNLTVKKSYNSPGDEDLDDDQKWFMRTIDDYDYNGIFFKLYFVNMHVIFFNYFLRICGT